MLADNQTDTRTREPSSNESAISTRSVLSLICRTTGRRRTPDECRHLDALVGEIRACATPVASRPRLS